MAQHPLRYFRNTTLRVSCPDYPPILTLSDDKTKFEGAVGSLLNELLETVYWKLQVTAGPIYRGKRVNGSFTDLYGLFERNEADFFPFPIPMDTEDDIPVNYGPPIGGLSHRIRSNYEPNIEELSLVSSLAVFSLEIWLLIIFTVLCVTLTYFMLKRKHGAPQVSFVTSFWDFFRYLLEQGQSDPRSVKERALVVTYCVGCFVLLMGYFSNLMSTDKVAVDLSMLVETLDDILRLNKTPLIMAQDPLISLYEHAKKGTAYEKIWTKILPMRDRVLVEFDPAKFDKYMKDKKGAMISYTLMLEITTPYTCRAALEKEKLWISRKDLDSALLFFFRSKNLTREAYAALDDIFYRLMESGLSNRLFLKSVEAVLEVQFEGRSPCLRRTIGEVVENVTGTGNDEYNVTFKDSKSMFVYLLCLLGVCFCVLVIEKAIVHPKVKVMQRMTTVETQIRHKISLYVAAKREDDQTWKWLRYLLAKKANLLRRWDPSGRDAAPEEADISSQGVERHAEQKREEGPVLRTTGILRGKEQTSPRFRGNERGGKARGLSREVNVVNNLPDIEA